MHTLDDHYTAISRALDAMHDAVHALRDAVSIPASGPVEALAKVSVSRILGQITPLYGELSQVQQIVTEASLHGHDSDRAY